MKIPVEVSDEVAASYGERYGYTEDAQVDLATFVGDSLETYLENNHLGLLAQKQEQSVRAPFAEKQAMRAERAAPPKPEPEAVAEDIAPKERVR